MKLLLLVTAAVAAADAEYTLDLARYFPGDTVERAERATLLAQVDAFGELQVPATTRDFSALLDTYDKLKKALHKHDVYVWIKAERNRDDKDAHRADDALVEAMSRLDDALTDILLDLGPAKADAFLDADAALSGYRNFVDRVLEHAAHDSKRVDAATLPAAPSMDRLVRSYLDQRRELAQAEAPRDATGREKFDTKWAPYLEREDAFADILIPIVARQDEIARTRGFSGAPEAAYFRADLPAAAVRDILAELRSSDTGRRYQEMVAEAAARRLNLAAAEVRPWQLEEADAWSPPEVSFGEAVQTILTAEQSMGAEYAAQYARLFDPAARRVDWCREEQCDDTGFSVGYAGITSGLFYGNYHGTTDSVRAVAHEAGHAVHRQFMSENQPRAVYNEGPRFVFESFAIFNELLLLERMSGSADTPQARAFYLRRVLDDMTFQVYGSAAETDLEESIYGGVREGTLRSAKDLDALTLEVFSRYNASQALDDRMKVYWARNRLYFTDPLYDVNYLFAGLLALEYLHLHEQGPEEFARKYVALLKNGLTDTPQTLMRQFLDIDMTDAHGLVNNAANVIEDRTRKLAAAYSAISE
ncbi:MAG TPA: M3 family metallopeptidase [Woeseiaceae bacterium]|nr:M3 family metallopeptidase [Woeseiaceae bacterium]